MKRAFTLIELLVVIAIIAILAAILFPVFAQAKAAAKKTASLSNAKQMTLAVLQYASSNNDGLPPNDSWGGRSVSAGWSFGTNMNWATWTMLAYDYVKSTALYGDPLAPPYTSANKDNPIYTPWGTQYGYNNSNLAPWDGTTITTKSSSQLGNPAGTVMLVSMYAQSESTFTDGGVLYYGYGTMTQCGRVDPPDCAPAPGVCFGNWGTGGGYNTQIKDKSFVAGWQTGGVSVRSGNGTITTFTDGHAARLSIGALAAGTNWKKDIAASAVAVNDESKYLWDDK